MKLYPKGDTPEASGYLSVYLSNQTESEVKARYEFTILGNIGGNILSVFKREIYIFFTLSHRRQQEQTEPSQGESDSIVC